MLVGLSIRSLGTNFGEVLIKKQNFSFMKMHLNIWSVKWRPFCQGVDKLTLWPEITCTELRSPCGKIQHDRILICLMPIMVEHTFFSYTSYKDNIDMKFKFSTGCGICITHYINNCHADFFKKMKIFFHFNVEYFLLLTAALWCDKLVKCFFVED